MAEAKEKPNRPNFILILVDQMRFDALGIAGNELIDTPYLDDLARRGIYFQNAYSSTPTCVPARVALFTGQSSKLHGRYGYSEGVNFPAAYPVTLPGQLGKAGYQTFGVGKMHVFPDRARCGFDDVLLHDGFLHYSRSLTRGVSASVDDYVDFLRRETADPRADYQDTGAGCNAMQARPFEREERLHPTRWVADESFRFLQRRDPTRPFFLYMSFHRPHAPFDPPGWLWDKYRERDFGAKPEIGESRSIGQRVHAQWVEKFAKYRKDYVVEAEFAHRKESIHQQVKAGYYGSIEFIDLQINRLVEQLSDQGLSDNTVLLFTSDHGEMLGDHDLYRKSVAYEGSSHVPLIMYVPPALQAQFAEAGMELTGVKNPSAIVELRDIMPTILQLAGAKIPATVDGLSMVPAVKGEELRPYLHGEHLISQLGWHSMQWIRSQKFKYIWFSSTGQEQLFELESDPYEMNDLLAAADLPGAAADLPGAALAESAGGNSPAAELDSSLANYDAEIQSVLLEHRSYLIAELTGREEGFVDEAGNLVPGRELKAMADWVKEFAAN